MTYPVGILVLEGGDAAGKTYLAKQLMARYPESHYIHGTVTSDAFAHHLEIAREAIRHSQDKLVVVDRQWISEQVYGPIIRGASQHNLAGRYFDRLWMKHAAIYVLCAPRDTEAQLARWHRDRDAGKEEYANDHQIKQVLAAFADLREGSVGHPGDLYVDQLIRWGDFVKRDDVKIYDMDKYSDTKRSLSKFMKYLVEDHLQWWRSEQYKSALDPRKINMTGHVANATHILIGKELSPRAPGPCPFFWSDTMSAATCINRALHELGHDETKTLMVNSKVHGHQQMLKDILDVKELKIVALGSAAFASITSQGYECTKLPYPRYVWRLKGHDFKGYVEKLREALR